MSGPKLKVSPPSFFCPAQRLLSEVLVSVSVEDEAVSRYWVSVSPLCPDGSTAKGRSCTGVQPNQTVSTPAEYQVEHTWSRNLSLPGTLASIHSLPRIVCDHTHTATLPRALHDREDLLYNPSWADYCLYLTGKHFHVIPWPFFVLKSLPCLMWMNKWDIW